MMRAFAGWKLSLIAIFFIVSLAGIVLTLIPGSFLGLGSKTWVLVVIVILALIELLKEVIIPERIEEASERRVKKAKAERIGTSFSAFLSRITLQRIDIGSELKKKFLETGEPLEKTVAELIMLDQSNDLDRDMVDCLVTLWLAYHWETQKTSPAKEEIRAFENLDAAIRSSFPNLKYSRRMELLMLGFKSMKNDWSIVPRRRTLKAVFQGKLGIREYQMLLYDFLARTGQQHVYEVLRADKAESLRQTLIQVIAQGKLSSYGLRKEVVSEIQRALQRAGADNTVFIILKNKFYELDEYLSSLPNLKGGPVSPHRLKSSEKNRLYHIILKPNRQYKDAEHFIEAEIRPRIQAKEGFVAVIPADISGSVIFPSHKDFVGKGLVPKNYEMVSSLLTGVGDPDLDIWMILAKHQVPVDKVLSILPLNVLTEGLPAGGVKEIWEKHERMKEHFGIERLSDWANVDPQKLAEYLSSSIVAFGLMPEEDLLSKCIEMIREARRIQASLLPTQLGLF